MSACRLPILQRIMHKGNTVLSAINVSRALLRLISVTVFRFTHPPVLSALRLILSVSGFLIIDFPLLVPSSFLSSAPLHGTTFPSLRQNPCLDSFKSNLKTCLFPKQYTCQVFLSVLLSFSAPCPCLLSSSSPSSSS